MTTLSSLQINQKAIIKNFDIQAIPLKLLEMGCLPESEVCLIQTAPFGCPLYLNINDCHVAIRLETASQIEIEVI